MFATVITLLVLFGSAWVWLWLVIKLARRIARAAKRHALQPDPYQGPADPLKRTDAWGGTDGRI